MSDTQQNTPQNAGGGEQKRSEGSKPRNNRNNRNRNRNRKPRPEGGEGREGAEKQPTAPQAENSTPAESGEKRADGDRGGRNRNNRGRNRNKDAKPANDNSTAESSNRNRNNRNQGPRKEVKAAPVDQDVQDQLEAEAALYDMDLEKNDPVEDYALPVLEKPVVGITCGDLNGIGMEVIIKTLAEEMITDFCTPVLFASSRLVSYHRNAIGMRDFNLNICDSLDDIRKDRMNLVNVWEDEVEINLGLPTDVSGAYALKSIDAAIAAAKGGKIDAIVTAPINKHNISAQVEGFSGHTGYLADALNDKVLMILSAERLNVATVTGHIPISKVASSLSQDKIEEALDLLIDSLKRDFGVIKPTIAVLGLNPHAGEWGTIGTEEQEVIAPAIAAKNGKAAIVKGPFPADGFFGQGYESKFDAVLGMYHDQVLVPFKSLSMGSGTNFTAGLSVVRTSPDHGTAMHLAGKGVADEHSFRSALFSAVQIWQKRTGYNEMLANPLKKQKAKD
ncbi:MAG: hypothetical protein RL754_886 [Bacteroidota bacterium]|jgi:4-hydroxythreonine-4-phosphate dehydrogenase